MSETSVEYVTALVGGQLFGLAISRVQDVFVPEGLTRVPLAAPEVAGLLNLRGRILTVVDLRRRLGLAAAGPGPSDALRPRVAIGIEHGGESYGLLIDEIGEVMMLPASSREENPINMDRGLAEVAAGVHRLDGRILVALDVDRVLAFDPCAKAA
jgi:purine-binding chemotaxis protein CheW